MSHFFRTLLRSPFPPLWASGAVLGLLASTLSGSAYGASLLWYGGDAGPPGLNNTMVNATFGDSILDDFIVSDAAGWHVTSLFSNNVADYPIDSVPFTQAVWSIRTGVSSGVPGDILFAGISPVTVMPTGRTFAGDVEYTVTVSGLSLDLIPGVYFMNVSPVAQSQIYYLGDSDGTNAIPGGGPSGFLQEEVFILNGVLQHTIREFSAARASMGVIGVGVVAVPEPSTSVLIGLGVLALVGFTRRHWTKSEGRVRLAALGLARNTTGAAISAGVPMCPVGLSPTAVSNSSGLPVSMLAQTPPSK